MNARFWQLAKQADLIQWDSLSSGVRTPDHESVVKAQKFAELIIRECGKVYIQNQQDGVMTLTQDLLQHFGVEE